jgi:hypothetical protein
MISDYGTLYAAVSEWLVRPELTYAIPEFISLAEERIARDVRCRQMVTTATLATVAGVESVALPDRWIEGVSLRITTPQIQLEYVTPEALRGMYGSTYSGLPSVYTIEGTNLILGPVPAQVYALQATYYQRFDRLETTASNALILIAPSLYLFAALAEAAPFLMDDQRAGMWESKYAASLRQVNATESSAASAGTSLRIRTR